MLRKSLKKAYTPNFCLFFGDFLAFFGKINKKTSSIFPFLSKTPCLFWFGRAKNGQNVQAECAVL